MPRDADRMPAPPQRAPDLDDAFIDGLGDAWVPHYLPHWTTPERSAARFDLVPDGVRLRIDADQPDWLPELPDLRVSNLQTASFAGPVGSTRGMHHRPDGLRVRTAVPLHLGWAPTAGRVDVTISASPASGSMTAVWLVGTEHLDPDATAELCVCEIDGEAIGSGSTRVRTGIKAHTDPSVVTDVREVDVPLDATRPHTWSVVWGDGRTRIGCEGVVVFDADQAPDAPLALMVDLFETAPPSGDYPKSAVVHRVRGWSG